jgi:D-sedoheptulose 7-phosphate isomerase
VTGIAGKELEKAAQAAAEAAAVGAQMLAGSEETIAAVASAAQLMIECLSSGGKILTCGNGGSMCEAAHLAEELTGRFRADRRPLGALSLSEPGHLSCVANDFGFEAVFSRAVQALGRPGDVLVALSTSGASANVVEAARAARAQGMEVICLVGRRNTSLGHEATVAIATPEMPWPDRVQEMHLVIIHMLVELVELGMGAALRG